MISKEKRQPKKNQKGYPPKKPATVIRIFRAFKHQYQRYCCYHETAESEHLKNERMLARWTRRLAIWTIVLGIMAIISAFIFWNQYKAMITANEESRLAFTSAQRAFLFVSNMQSKHMIDDSGQQIIRIAPIWTNSGETPTNNLQIAIFCWKNVSELDYKSPKFSFQNCSGQNKLWDMGIAITSPHLQKHNLKVVFSIPRL